MKRAAPKRLPVGEPRSPNALPSGTTKEVPLGQLRESALNPRRTFAQEATEELAKSLLKKGLVQPLVVRALPGEQAYEVCAGGRRLRALRWLVEQARLAPDTLVKVEVRELGDREVRELALIENLQRKDMDPLEEGEAFIDLVGDSQRGAGATAELAERIGMTARYVQQRIALVRKLSPPAKEALRAGRLKLDQARALSRIPQEHQEQLLDEIDEDTPAAEIRSDLAEDLVGPADALFDPASWPEGETEEDPELGEVYVDQAAFRERQEEALAGKIRELEKQSWVEIRTVPQYSLNQLPGGFGTWTMKLKAGAKRGTVVTTTRSGRVRFHENVWRFSDTEAPTSPRREGVEKPSKKQQPLTDTQISLAWVHRVQALQRATAASADNALRLLCLRFLDPSTPAAVNLERFREPSPGIEAQLDKLKVDLKLKGCRSAAERWARLLATPKEQLLILLGHFVALSLEGSHNAFFPRRLGDDDLVVALAKTLKVPHAGVPSREYLQGYRKARLIAIARELGLPETAANEGMKVAALVAAVHAAIQKRKWVPPELRFESPQGVVAALKAKPSRPRSTKPKARKTP